MDTTTLLEFIDTKEELKKSHPLRYLLWEATIRCNLECIHCYRECGPFAPMQEELKESQIKQVLLDISKQYNPSNIFFGITGGEPFLRRDIIDIGAYANSLGYQWGIVTNGLFFNQTTIDELKKYNISSLAISLDGLELENNSIRGKNSNFQKVIESIKLLIENGLKDIITIKFCANRLNIGSIEKFIAFIKDLGVKKLNISPIFYYGKGKNQELSLTPQELLFLLEFVKNYRNKKSSLDVAIDDGYFGAEYEMKIRDGLFFSIAGVTMATILYNGDIAGSTHTYNGKLIEGNIKKDNFLEIWEKGFRFYRDKKEEFFYKSCKDCQDWVLCEGDSIYNIEQLLDKEECRYKQLKQALA